MIIVDSQVLGTETLEFWYHRDGANIEYNSVDRLLTYLAVSSIWLNLIIIMLYAAHPKFALLNYN